MDEIKYQFCILGDAADVTDDIQKHVIQQISELGLDSEHIDFLDASSIADRVRKAPCAVVFFGYEGANEQTHEELAPLIDDSLLIVPIVADTDRYGDLTPANLKDYNGISNIDGVESACTLILEHFRLLRSERRLFISYKRKESSTIAHQLYEAFDQIGYDVFLDTRSVSGGAVFQEVLWHRMADSDVVVLLDSPNFHKSEWTQAEYARALASDIQIQHILWPGVSSKKETALDEYWPLVISDFQSTQTIGENAQLSAETIKDIVKSTEQSRARAMSARNTALIDGFCDLARESGHVADLQPGLSIKLRANGAQIAVVPMVGVPTASRLHQLITRARKDDPNLIVWALYDHMGILDSIVDHLAWLNDNLPVMALRKLDSRAAVEGL